MTVTVTVTVTDCQSLSLQAVTVTASGSGTSGILYTWTGLGKSVHTGTYQYVPVQHGTRQYENLTVVRTVTVTQSR